MYENGNLESSPKPLDNGGGGASSNGSNAGSNTRPLLYYVYSNYRLQNAIQLVQCVILCIFAVMLVVSAMSTAHAAVNTVILFAVIVCGIALFSFVKAVISIVRPAKNFTPSFLCKNAKKRNGTLNKNAVDKPRKFLGRFWVSVAILAFIVYCIIYLISLIAADGRFAFLAKRPAFILLLIPISVVGGCIAAAHLAAKRNNELCKYLFGVYRPTTNHDCLIDFDLNKEIELYNQYRANKKYKNIDDMSARTHDGRSAAECIKTRRITLIASAAVIAVCAIFAAISIPVMTRKFSAKYVQKIPDTISQSNADDYLQDYLGKPDAEESESINVSDTTVSVYKDIYFDDNDILDLYNQIKSIEKQLKDEQSKPNADIDKAETLQARLERLQNLMLSKSFVSLEVVYMRGDEESKIVLSITLDMNNGAGAFIPKIEKSRRDYTYDNRMYIEIEYTDGSYTRTCVKQ